LEDLHHPNWSVSPEAKVERDIFNEWFNLAKKQRLVMGSSKGENGELYVYTPEAVPVSFQEMLAKHPIETLRQKN
jgi:hypothetical protein